MDSEANRFKLDHSYAFTADILKRIKVEGDDIEIKYEVLGETGANQSEECFDLDVSSVSQKLKSYSRSNSTALLSEVSEKAFPVNDTSVDMDTREVLECPQNYKEKKTEEKVCRFCFKMCCNFKTIDGDIIHKSDVLLPGIDLSAVQEPVMCTHCEEVLSVSFDFKARCLYTHDYLSKKNDGVKLNLKEIYMTNHKNNINILEDQNICGFCMCPVKNCSATYLDVGQGYVTLRKTLGQCLPELDLSIVEEPVICAPCHASLENHSRFVTNILIGEEKITKYKEFLDINSKSQIDLSSLLQFLVSEVDGNDGDVIKLDNMTCDQNDSVKEVEHKCNTMDIDDPKFNNEQKFTTSNVLECKVESNEIDAIKIEAQDGTEFKEENIIKVEDRKMLFDEAIDIKTDELDFNSFENGIVTTQLNARLNGKLDRSALTNFDDNKAEKKYYRKAHFLKHKNPLEVTLHKCDSCAYQTNRKSNLKSHSLTHKDISEMLKYKCDSCAYQTILKGNLKRHLLNHKDISEVTMHKCESCAYQTVTKSHLKSHLLKHMDISEGTMYKCDSCAYQSRRKSCFKLHLMNHKDISEVTMHKCDSCTYQTVSKGNLKLHLLKHKDISEVMVYKCESCAYQTRHKSCFKVHLLYHKDISEVTMHKCDSCAYQTKRKSNLKSHLLYHKDISEVTMHKCDSCTYQTVSKGNLKLHLLKHKDISEVMMHKCESCAYQTRHKSCFKVHLLYHKDISEVTMHKCDSCAYQTVKKSHLKLHLLMHKDISEVTMYKCDSCAYQSRRRSSVKRHLLNHKNTSEVTMYKCDSCTYQTIYKSALKSHLLKHKDISELILYKCDSCSYQTKRKPNLKKHILTH